MTKGKEKTVRAVNMRLTESEYDEYIQLGGIKWIRLFLKHSADMRKHLELESYDKQIKKVVKQNLIYHTKNIKSGTTEGVVAVPKSKWQIVRKIASTTEESN